MNTIFVLLALIAAVTAKECLQKKIEEFNKIRAECLACGPMPAEALDALNKLEYLDVESVRKYILCLAMKSNLYTEEKGLHVNGVVEKLSTDETEATAIVKECFDMNEETISADVFIYRGFKCLLGSKLGAEIKGYFMTPTPTPTPTPSPTPILF